VQFILSVHGDIPVGPDGHSVPGEVLWNRLFHAGEFNAVVYADSIDEGWMEPPDEYWFPADHTCWLYKFLVPLDDAFFQRGSLIDPIVYWLNVQAFPYDQSAIFGWKTSHEHWNDAAVWGLGSEPYPGPWLELIYPPGHEMYGGLIDLAFRLTTDPLSDVPGGEGVPDGFGLHRNVPNPFRAKTTIRYNLPESGHVKLGVYDVTGRLVRTLVDEAQPRGIHIATWKGSDSRNEQVPPGIYFCRLTSGQKTAIQKMLFLK
jgi:hypothetical protein